VTAGSIGLVAATAAGRRQAEILASAWPQARLIGVDPQTGAVADALRRAWSECDAVVVFLAVGAAVRILAPLLGDKGSDPPVVAVDEAGRHAVALLGGHAAGGAGANRLAERVGELIGARPVITTATDAAGIPGLDQLGLPVEGAVAAVSRAILDGLTVQLDADATWPLPALPDNVRVQAAGEGASRLTTSLLPVAVSHENQVGAGSSATTRRSSGAETPALAYRIMVTDRVSDVDARTVVLRPPSLVVGVGASRGVGCAQVLELVERVLTGAGLSRSSIACLATVDAKSGEAGILDAARVLGVGVELRTAAELARVRVPHPSEVVRLSVGTPSVAEAAALHVAGAVAGVADTAALLVPKTASPMATVAIARRRPRGRLAIVGLGPGARDLITPRAVTELRRAGVVVGLDQYVDQVRDLLRPGTRVLATALGQEEARAGQAVAEAVAGHAVALVGSGDAGVYAMASPALEGADASIDVVVVPGVTAGLAASALLGAPLGHDHVYLSLSDLHTPWEVIDSRVRAAAEGDLVVLFYNPRSRSRDWQLAAALTVLGGHRPPDTPVAVVRNASRRDERIHLATLATFDPAIVDMSSLVVVGSSRTRVIAGRMVTPRGYRWSR
jgi:cobalt-precorrin 5A hydrolase/precorrin-3B C17-methyltransferase